MPERTVVVASSHGLHARPAAIFTQAAGSAGVPVRITKGTRTVNAASILGVISLGVSHGDEVQLIVDGEDSDGVLDQLTELLTTDHDA